VKLEINRKKLFKEQRISKQIPLKNILVEHSSYITRDLKIRLINDGFLIEKCSNCGLGPKWKGKSLTLVLDHKNGINNDHRIEKLRLLCPNCDSQQMTYKGRNRKKNCCSNCGAYQPFQRSSKSKLCIKCSNQKRKERRNQRKVEWPSKEQLYLLIIQYPFTHIAKIYGVSETAVRKWCKTYELPYRKRDIKGLLQNNHPFHELKKNY
jgi:hypothetical protein